MLQRMESLTASDLARMIDISAVQAFHGKEEIDRLITYAKKFMFISVHALPSWASYLSKHLSENRDILVGAPVGFPSGGTHMLIKIAEAKQLITDGVQEIDMVLNIGKLLSGDVGYVREEIRRIRETVGKLPLKVILDVYHLEDHHIRTACDICIEEKVDFIKTGTGWTPTGATYAIIELLTGYVQGRVKIKASGGVRDLETLLKMYKMGVDRFGINLNTSIKLIEECASRPGGRVTVP